MPHPIIVELVVHKLLRYWPWLKYVGAVIMLLLAAWLARQQFGPQADGLREDPLAVYNRRGDAIVDNAAPLYKRAINAIKPSPVGEWQKHVGLKATPLPEPIATWICENELLVDLAREAAGKSECFFDLRRARNGMISPVSINSMRDLARFLALRARWLSEQRDTERLIDTLEIMQGIAKHLFQHDGVIEYLSGMSATEKLHEYVLSAYDPANVERLLRFCEPLPSFAAYVQADMEELVWAVSATVAAAATDEDEAVAIFPPRRFRGELQNVYAPYIEFARLPVEQQMDRSHPIWTRFEQRTQSGGFLRTLAYFWNLPRGTARSFEPRLGVAFELRTRVITRIRANRTVLAILAVIEEQGRAPKSLAELNPAPPLDPYTARPFIYRTTHTGFTLYSTAADADDDGDQHHHRFGYSTWPPSPAAPPDGDYVFWPVQYSDD